MDIRTKYSIGDKIKVRANKKIRVNCPFCNGEGFKIVNGEQLYCQNCDEGKLTFRSKEDEEVEGIITGIRYEEETLDSVNIEDDIDRELYTKITDESAITVEYFIDVPDEYYGYSTYNEKKLK